MRRSSPSRHTASDQRGEVTLTIEKLTAGGSGLGRVDGKVCFVPFTAPGDRVRACITANKSSYLQAELLELITPAPERCLPPCPIFGSCGGCQWQHLPYELQLQAKGEIFRETVERMARVPAERIAPVVPSPNPFAYRGRVQLKLRFVEGELLIGFYRGASHWVVPLPGCCAIADDTINSIIATLLAHAPHMPWPERVPQIDLAVGDNGGATIILHHLGEHGEEFAQFLTSLPGLPNGCGLYLQSGRKESLQYLSGTNCLTYTVTDTPLHPPLTLAFSGGGFSQVNYPQNRQLIGLVEELAALTGQERLLDLYCGNGNFTIPLAAAAVDVVAIESYAPSLADGRENARTNNRTNIEFLCRDAARGVQEQIAAGQRFDVIVLDPPRSGAAEVVHLLAELSPERIIYVSCDPATLGRDLATLRRSGYEVITSVPVDMFPQTSHLESVTLLMREQNDTV